MIPFFDKDFFIKISKFFWKFPSKNVSKIVLCLENRPKFVKFLPFDPSLIFSLIDFFFLKKKSLTKRPLVLSCCPSIPVTFNVEWPPPPHGLIILTLRWCRKYAIWSYSITPEWIFGCKHSNPPALLVTLWHLCLTMCCGAWISEMLVKWTCEMRNKRKRCAWK